MALEESRVEKRKFASRLTNSWKCRQQDENKRNDRSTKCNQKWARKRILKEKRPQCRKLQSGAFAHHWMAQLTDWYRISKAINIYQFGEPRLNPGLILNQVNSWFKPFSMSALIKFRRRPGHGLGWIIPSLVYSVEKNANTPRQVWKRR